LYLLEQVVAAEAGATVAVIMPDAPRNMIASENLRMVAFPAL
jgi:hypothetical protein